MIPRELAELLERVAKAAERSALVSAQHLQLAERNTKWHAGDKLLTLQEGPLFGGADVAPSSQATLVSMTPPPGYDGTIVRWANEASDEITGADPWATTPTALDGVVFQFLIGDRPYFRNPVNSPHGYIGTGNPTWIPWGSNDTVQLVAINLDPVREIHVCGQVWFEFVNVYEGRRG